MPCLKNRLACLSEKSRDSAAFAVEQSVLSSPVCLRIIAKMRHFRVLQRKAAGFSAVQTSWRRGRNSNRRYRSEWQPRWRAQVTRCAAMLNGAVSISLGDVIATLAISVPRRNRNRSRELPCFVICPSCRRFPLDSSNGTSPVPGDLLAALKHAPCPMMSHH